MSLYITVKHFRFGIFNAVSQLNTFCILCCHIDLDISRNTVFPIRQPFDRAGVFQRCHTDRLSVYIDLCVVIRHLKL